MAFTGRVIVFLMPLALIVFGFETALWRTGDLRPARLVVAEQHAAEEEVLYGRFHFSQQFNVYKQAGLRGRRPTIVVVGSSRVMQFRDLMFPPLEREFYNAGGMIRNVFDLQDFADRVADGRLPAPRVALVGIDPWWLKPDAGNGSWLAQRDVALDPAAHVTVMRRLVSGGDIRGLVQTASMPPVTPYFGHHAIGTTAKVWGHGFRRDGSRQYDPSILLRYLDDPRYEDREDPPMIDRARRRCRQFAPPFAIDPDRVDRLLAALERLRSAGIEVHVVLPPFSTDVFAELEAGDDFQPWWTFYTRDLPTMLESAGIPFIAVTRPADWGLDDRFMYDGIHPSEVFVAHLVRRLVTGARDDSHLRRVDLETLDRCIAGAAVPLAFEVPARPGGS